VDETRTFAGLRGSFKGFGYDLRFSQLVSRNNAQFFTNTYIVPVFSDAAFDVQNADLKAWNPHISLSYDKGSQFGAKAWFDYFIYNKNTFDELSYQPKLKAGVSAYYNWNDKLYFNLDITGIGKRDALVVNHALFTDTKIAVPVKGLIDINLSANYFITKNIGVFLDLNNLGFQHWQRYYKYDTYGFHVIAGVKLSF
jgi:hypothetical protein